MSIAIVKQFNPNIILTGIWLVVCITAYERLVKGSKTSLVTATVVILILTSLIFRVSNTEGGSVQNLNDRPDLTFPGSPTLSQSSRSLQDLNSGNDHETRATIQMMEDLIGNESSAVQCKIIQASLHSQNDKIKVSLTDKGYCGVYNGDVEICCKVANSESFNANTSGFTEALPVQPIPAKFGTEIPKPTEDLSKVQPAKSCEEVLHHIRSPEKKMLVRCNNRKCCELRDEQIVFCCPISKILKLINAGKQNIALNFRDHDQTPEPA